MKVVCERAVTKAFTLNSDAPLSYSQKILTSGSSLEIYLEGSLALRILHWRRVPLGQRFSQTCCPNDDFFYLRRPQLLRPAHHKPNPHVPNSKAEISTPHSQNMPIAASPSNAHPHWTFPRMVDSES